MTLRDRHTGKVTAFDEARGLGTVTDDGGGDFLFHCTAIADKSRRIDVGVTVTFVLAHGHLGRMEARGLTPLASAR